MDDNFFNVVVLEELIISILPNAKISKFYCPLKSLEHITSMLTDDIDPFDIAILDINMPQMSGYDLESNIRTLYLDQDL